MLTPTPSPIQAQPAVTDYRTAVGAEQDVGSRRALRWPGASVSEELSEKKLS